MSELEQVTALCVRLGAGEAQAAAMAAHLLRRADQLAAERGITRVEAVMYLINLLLQGRQGQVLPGPKE